MFALERRFHHRGHGEHRKEKARRGEKDNAETQSSPRFAEKSTAKSGCATG
jgi:hypothetical protein